MIGHDTLVALAAARAGMKLEAATECLLGIYCSDSDAWGIMRPHSSSGMTDADFAAWVQSFLLPEIYNPEWAFAVMDWEELIEKTIFAGDPELFQWAEIHLKESSEEFWSRVDRFREVNGDES